MAFLRFSLLLVLSSAASAFAQPSLSGNRETFVVTDCANASFTLRFTFDRKPVAIRTGDISRRPAATPPPWTIGWDRPVPTDAVIDEYESTGHLKSGCPQSGIFRVPLTIISGDRQSSALEITLARVFDPVLDVPSSATLPTNRLFGAPDPVSLAVRETALSVAPVPLAISGGELKSASGEATGITLDPVQSPIVLKAGSNGEVALLPSQTPPPGAYTTRLVLHSPALRQDATVDVTYKVRFSPALLLLAILVGIGVGLIVNRVLARRSALSAAMLNGSRAMQDLARRAGPQRDPAVQQRLIAVATHLDSTLTQARTPQEVADATLEAETEAKRIEDAAVSDAASLQQTLAANRAMFRPDGEPLDELLKDRLAMPLGQLDALQRAVDAGEIEQAWARLQDLVHDLQQEVIPKLHAFLADCQGELQALGPLPDRRDLEPTRVFCLQQISIAYAAQDITQAVRAAAAVAKTLRGWMDASLPGALAAVWRDAAPSLETKLPMLSARLARAAGEAELLRRATRDPVARLGALAGLNRSMTDMMTEAAGDDAADVQGLLTGGDLRGATRLLAGVQLMGRMTPVPDEETPAATQWDQPVALSTAGPVAAVLRVKSLIPLGQASLVTVRWIGVAPPHGAASWRCDPADAADIKAQPAGAIVRPRTAGFLTLSVEVGGATVAEATTYAGEVINQSLYAIVPPRQGWAVNAIAVITAVLTVLAGYEILGPSWYGTAGNVFAAVLWGFFGQFGLDRVRELAQPLVTKQMSR